MPLQMAQPSYFASERTTPSSSYRRLQAGSAVWFWTCQAGHKAHQGMPSQATFSGAALAALPKAVTPPHSPTSWLPV